MLHVQPMALPAVVKRPFRALRVLERRKTKLKANEVRRGDCKAFVGYTAALGSVPEGQNMAAGYESNSRGGAKYVREPCHIS